MESIVITKKACYKTILQVNFTIVGITCGIEIKLHMPDFYIKMAQILKSITVSSKILPLMKKLLLL